MCFWNIFTKRIALSFGLTLCGFSTAAEKPNFVFFIADDISQED